MHALRTLFSDAVGLYRRHPVVAIFTWLPCLLLVVIQPRSDMAGVAVAAGLVTLTMQGVLSMYGLWLERRMSATGDSTWTVQVYGADLGAISDAECAAMRHRAAFSVANYLRQLVNLAEMAVNFLRLMTRTVPFLVFWLVVGGLLLDTTSTVLALRKLWLLAQTYPAVLTTGVTQWLAFTLTLGALLCVVLSLRAIGFCNQFRADWEHELRRRLNLPATESPRLYRLDGNDRVAAAEMTEFKEFLRDRLGLKGRPGSAAAGGAR